MKNPVLHILSIFILVATGLLLSLGLSSETDLKTADREFTVVAKQWSWTFYEGSVYGDVKDRDKLSGLQLEKGTTVAFRLQSEDVFHTFAIYSPAGKLVAQKDLIPAAYRELKYTFAERGEYQILCLEYCGMAHAHMAAKINVR